MVVTQQYLFHTNNKLGVDGSKRQISVTIKRMMRMFPVMQICLLYSCVSFWSVSAAYTKAQRADFEVRGLEDIVPAFESFEGQMYAGLLPIAHPSIEKGEEGEYMFWLFEPEAPAVDDSLIICTYENFLRRSYIFEIF